MVCPRRAKHEERDRPTGDRKIPTREGLGRKQQMHPQLAQRIDERPPVFGIMLRLVFEDAFQRQNEVIGCNRVARIAGLVEGLDDGVGQSSLRGFGGRVGHCA